MRRAVLCAALAIGVLPSSSGAQSNVLSEADALSRLSADSPRARAIRAGIEVARADVLAASRWPNPRLTVQRESVASVTEYLTMVAQPLPITGRRPLEIQAASAVVAATSSRADEQMQRLRADLRIAFAGLVATQSRERELAATRDRLRDLAAILARREAAGDSSGFDRLRAERETLDVETDLALAAAERARAQAILSGFFGAATDPSTVVASDEGRRPMDVPTLDALIDRAESTRGVLLALAHEAEAARFSARAAERRAVPEPEIVAGTKSSTSGTGDIGSVISVHAAIPLFDRARPERVRAEARAAQADAEAAAVRQVLRAEITSLRAAVIDRRTAAARYRESAQGSVNEIERIAEISYEAGERGILELLDAYRLVSGARVRQAALDLAVREAEIELAFASGWEMP